MSAALTDMALALRDEARALGLAVDRLEASRCLTSASRYLHFRDAAGRGWELRVSDHAAGLGASSRPHFDLVFRPGERDQALEAARGWLRRVADGLVAWREATR